MFHAAESGYLKVVQLLIERGANKDLKSGVRPRRSVLLTLWPTGSDARRFRRLGVRRCALLLRRAVSTSCGIYLSAVPTKASEETCVPCMLSRCCQSAC